jgi:(R)-2-hydroxyacyl-CoA dehydratese activating ATPase
VEDTGMHYVAGIDSGSGFTKAVIISQRQPDRPPVVLGLGFTRTGAKVEESARAALKAAAENARIDLSEVSYIAATGFGRYGISFRDVQITEITSAARGANYLNPHAGIVLDIGSQSTRAVALKDGGKVGGFKTNDKCAAGSGSFIQRAAKYLQVGIEDVGELALQSENSQPISSVCAVLAESEIINHVSLGVGVEDILRGIYDSLADRAALLLKRVQTRGKVAAPASADEEKNSEGATMFIGGVATQRGMVKALEQRLGIKVEVPSDCEYVCALGAALLGLKRLESSGRNPLEVSDPKYQSDRGARLPLTA